MILTASAYSLQHRKLIITLVLRHQLPTVHFLRGFVADGGLISYGSDTIDLHRRAASHVERILKGEKPADLPVQALPPQYDQLMSECSVPRLKSAIRLERRGEQGQEEPEQSDHRR
jgi:putative ABC transport system substrate-binding protein